MKLHLLHTTLLLFSVAAATAKDINEMNVSNSANSSDIPSQAQADKEESIARTLEYADNLPESEDDEDEGNLRGYRDSFYKYSNKVCRKRYGRDGRNDRDYIQIEYFSRNRCKKVCLYFQYCYGWEYKSSTSTCEIWHGSPIDKYSLEYRYGTDCYIHRDYDDHYLEDDHWGENDDDGYDPFEPIVPVYANPEEECIQDCKDKYASRPKPKKRCIKKCKEEYGRGLFD